MTWHLIPVKMLGEVANRYQHYRLCADTSCSFWVWNHWGVIQVLYKSRAKSAVSSTQPCRDQRCYQSIKENSAFTPGKTCWWVFTRTSVKLRGTGCWVQYRKFMYTSWEHVFTSLHQLYIRVVEYSLGVAQECPASYCKTHPNLSRPIRSWAFWFQYS